MEGKKRRGKGGKKVTMKLIENKEQRVTTFSKRRSGIYKKANELITICGAEVAFLVFSPAGKAYTFGHPSFDNVVGRYLGVPMPSDPLVEAERKERVDELSKVHDKMMERLEAEKNEEIKKTATKSDAAGGPGTSKERMWWEIPINELNKQELQETKAAYEEILEMVIRKLEQKNMILANNTSIN